MDFNESEQEPLSLELFTPEPLISPLTISSFKSSPRIFYPHNSPYPHPDCFNLSPEPPSAVDIFIDWLFNTLFFCCMLDV